MGSQFTIAIVGGGATGVCLANKMVEGLPVGLSTAAVSLILFDPRGCNGGTAYSPDVASNLTNTTCGAVDRAFGGEFGILDWARDNPAKWQPYTYGPLLDESTYLPRPVVGSYLSDLAQHARRRAAERGMTFEMVVDEVVDISPPDRAEGDYTVQTKSGESFGVRYVYLALGHLQRAKTEDYQRHDRYYHDPYPITRLIEEIPKSATVGIVGTRLSAIDVVLGLVLGGHKGEIHCVSRGGRLPAVRGDHGRYEFMHLERNELIKQLVHAQAKLRLTDIAAMLGTEIEHAEGRPVDLGDIMHEYLPAAEYYEREIALAKGKARPWQTVLYATNRNIDLLWHHLEEEDKRILMSQWLNDWLTSRASIPRENAERVLSLLKSGQLTVRGGVTGFQIDSATGNFRSGFVDGHRIDFRYLVAATGSASRIEDADSRLMRNLLAKGLVVPHRSGAWTVFSRPGNWCPDRAWSRASAGHSRWVRSRAASTSSPPRSKSSNDRPRSEPGTWHSCWATSGSNFRKRMHGWTRSKARVPPQTPSSPGSARKVPTSSSAPCAATKRNGSTSNNSTC